MTTHVYSFGDGHADGTAEMKNLLGGKGANLAEMMGMNAHGGNPHVVAAIRNDDWWEVGAWPAIGSDRSMGGSFPPGHKHFPTQSGLIGGMTEIRDGFMYITQEPGLGRTIDWDQIEARTIMRI